MSSSHDSFDEAVLWKRKDSFSGFQYCPLTGHRLIKLQAGNVDRLKCSDKACDFVFYHNPVPAAGVILVHDSKVLLVQRAQPPKKDWWSLPAGFMEWGEHPTVTAIRETHEETGLTVKLESLFQVYTGHDDPRTNAVLILYLATVTSGDLTPGDDASDASYFALDALPEKIAFLSHRQALQDYRERYR